MESTGRATIADRKHHTAAPRPSTQRHLTETLTRLRAFVRWRIWQLFF